MSEAATNENKKQIKQLTKITTTRKQNKESQDPKHCTAAKKE